MSKCRDCDAPILWGTDEKGTRIPLDRRPILYRVRFFDGGSQTYAIERLVHDGPTYMVNHLATCPKGKRTSGKTQERPDHRSRAAGQ